MREEKERVRDSKKTSRQRESDGRTAYKQVLPAALPRCCYCTRLDEQHGGGGERESCGWQESYLKIPPQYNNNQTSLLMYICITHHVMKVFGPSAHAHTHVHKKACMCGFTFWMALALHIARNWCGWLVIMLTINLSPATSGKFLRPT